MNWQPIETAAKDGARVLLWVDGVVLIGIWYVHWLNGEPHKYRPPGWEQADTCFGYIAGMGPLNPSHWMPLPEPPA